MSLSEFDLATHAREKHFLSLLLAWYTIFLQIFTFKCEDLDILLPYRQEHGSRRSHRYIRECQSVKYGNVTHELYSSHRSPLFSPITEVHHLINSTNVSHIFYVHIAFVNNPLKTVSVLEPGGPGGCNKRNPKRETVKNTARTKNCLLATNAGYFNTKTSACIGNIISNGEKIQDSGGIQNAHFGIKNDGRLFFGYLSENDYDDGNFLHLVGGVIWLLRNGEVYINESNIAECSDSEETGTLETFTNIQSARTAVGHDINGRVVLAHVEGKTGKFGISLWDFAHLLKSYGVINAINLDGGGSATYVINNTVVNYPSDICGSYNCERAVSTILCVHEPACDPPNCSNHGTCILGKCHCDDHWLTSACNELDCESNKCNSRGTCTHRGCKCQPGFIGRFCELECPTGFYGINCSQVCSCPGNTFCDRASGECICPLGYTGKFCELECPFNHFGLNCAEQCNCPFNCACDHVTGNCNTVPTNSSVYLAATCVANKVIENQHLVASTSKDYRLWVIATISSSFIAALSIIINLLLVLCKYSKSSNHYSYQVLSPKFMENSEEIPLTEDVEKTQSKALESTSLTRDKSKEVFLYDSK